MAVFFFPTQLGDDKVEKEFGRFFFVFGGDERGKVGDGARNFLSFFPVFFPETLDSLNTAGLLRSNWRCWIKYGWKMCKVNIRGILGFPLFRVLLF